MGCAQSAEDKENAKIELAQREKMAQEAKTIKLLVLGTGDSGKTTLRKQIVNVHTPQFDEAAFREAFATIILGNLVENTKEILQFMGNNDDVQKIEDNFGKVSKFLNEEQAKILKGYIFEMPEFQVAMKKSSEVQVQDCYMVFAEKLRDNFPTWGGQGWIPETEDCIRSRVRTSGVVTEDVTIDGVKFVIYDVGGQRAERRKWLHSFENMTAAIYVASISEYDQVLFEDRNKNRLLESLELFGEAVNSPWLSKTTIILFLNKRDLFEKKFVEEKVPLNASGKFPTAPTDNTDLEAAVEWVTQQFRSQRNKEESDLYVHVTTATDPGNVKTVFNACRNTIIKESMKSAGF